MTTVAKYFRAPRPIDNFAWDAERLGFFQAVPYSVLPADDAAEGLLGFDELEKATVTQYLLQSDNRDIGSPEKRWGGGYFYYLNVKYGVEFEDGDGYLRIPRFPRQPAPAGPETRRQDDGYLYVNLDTLEANIYLDGEDRPLVTTTQEQDLSNKHFPDDPPFTVDSTTVVTNLNADLLDGYHASHFGTAEKQDTMFPFYNGAAVQSPRVWVTESGGTVYFNIERSGGGDVDFVFGAEIYTLDCTPTAQIALTAGSDSVPIQNFLYITEAAGVLTLEANTTGWPTTSHAPVATVIVQSPTSVGADGPYKMHAWTDHISKATENGHLAHINRWIRNRPAAWISGVAASRLTIVSPDAHFTTTAGLIFQLHEHDFPALDMSVDGAWVVNDSVTPYKHIHTFADINADSSGGTINNRWLQIVVWGVISEDAADCKLFLNLPSGTYSTETGAENDVSKYTNFSIPSEYTGTGFLIASYVVRGSTTGTWVEGTNSPIDLRGQLAPTSAGGGPGVTDHFDLTSIGVTSHADIDTHIGSITDVHGVASPDEVAAIRPPVIVDEFLTVGSGGVIISSGYSAVSFEPAGATYSLDDLDDVEATSPNDGDGIFFNTVTGDWESGPPTAGAGDVTGPGSAVGDNFASFAGTTGKIIQDSGVKASDFEDAGEVAAHAALTTGVHGVGAGAVVGTTLTQTLTNKTLSGGAIAGAVDCGTGIGQLNNVLLYLPAAYGMTYTNLSVGFNGPQVSPTGTWSSTRLVKIPYQNYDRTYSFVEDVETFSGKKTTTAGLDIKTVNMRLSDNGTTEQWVTINVAAQTADRTVGIPALGGDRTFAFLEQIQTFTALQTFSGHIKTNQVDAISGVVAVDGINVANMENYSTSEVDTGATDHNGDTIYKKTWTSTDMPSSGTDVTISHGLTTLNKVVHMRGIMEASTGSFWPIPHPDITGGTTNGLQLIVTSSNIILRSEHAWTSDGDNWWVTLFYTKT